MKHILDFFRTDLWRKFIALALTCVLYWNLSDREQITRTLTVPVEIEVASGLFLPADYKLDVRVNVKGPERSLHDLKIKGRVKVDRSDRRNGHFRIRLDERCFERRKDVEIVRIDPEDVELPVQMYIRKDVKVVVKTEGMVFDGYELKSIQCEPATVRISGPENEVNAVDFIETEPLKLDFDRNFTQKLKLIKPQLPNVVCSTVETIVKVDIVPVLNERRTFENVRIRYLFPQTAEASAQFQQENIIASAKQVTVTLSAPESVLKQINPENLYVAADLGTGNISAGEPVLNVSLFCPAAFASYNGGRIREVDIKPASITVSVRKKSVPANGKKQ